MSNIPLPRDQFDVLKQDDVEIVLYDKKVDKLYTYTKAEQKWHFPPGSRMEVIEYLTGLKLY